MQLLNIGCELPRHYAPHEDFNINLDIWAPYLKGKENPIHADARALPFRPGSFDVCVAVEVIEHLEKAEGLKLVQDMTSLARILVVFTTPKHFFNQPNLDGNPYQQHKSHYTPQDFPSWACGEISYPWGPELIFSNRGPPQTAKSIQEGVDLLIRKVKGEP